ncbi:hypothetical protein ACH5RR_001036 [Cinchona calisaya]|uniref:Uncharacterized protein n=1 Tax=Cinchona calisaya TaxID=153742 RepID=A0ABD3B2A8_9GENT
MLLKNKIISSRQEEILIPPSNNIHMAVVDDHDIRVWNMASLEKEFCRRLSLTDADAKADNVGDREILIAGFKNFLQDIYRWMGDKAEQVNTAILASSTQICMLKAHDTNSNNSGLTCRTWLLRGDFNIIASTTEYIGPRCLDIHSIQEFNTAINACRIKEILFREVPALGLASAMVDVFGEDYHISRPFASQIPTYVDVPFRFSSSCTT